MTLLTIFYNCTFDIISLATMIRDFIKYHQDKIFNYLAETISYIVETGVNYEVTCTVYTL